MRCHLTYSAVDEWSGVTLGITIASSILGTSLVQRSGRFSSIGFHFAQVKSTIHSTGKLADVDVESQFTTGELEHLVALLALLEEVYTWRDRASSCVQL